jgi:Transcriptional Coactivator p15 (PC4)
MLVKNAKTQIRVELSEFKGKNLINIREWADYSGGEFKPTPKGITFSPEMYKEFYSLVRNFGIDNDLISLRKKTK